MNRTLGITVGILLFLSVADIGAFDFVTGHGPGLGRTIMLSKSSASALLLAPSPGILPGEGKVEFGINRKFEMKDLDQAYVAAAYRWHPVTVAVGYSQFGYADYYSERTARLTAAFHYGQAAAGVGLSTMTVSFGDHYESLSGTAFSLGVSFRHDRLFAALVADNLNSPRMSDRSPANPPCYTAYAEIVGLGSYSVTARTTIQEREKPQYGFGQIIHLSANGSVFWGVSTQPLTYGGGVEISYRGAAITYAANYHPVLGFSHTLSTGYSFGGAVK